MYGMTDHDPEIRSWGEYRERHGHPDTTTHVTRGESLDDHQCNPKCSGPGIETRQAVHTAAPFLPII